MPVRNGISDMAIAGWGLSARERRVGADGVSYIGKSVAHEERREVALDAPDQSGSFVDQCGVELDEARAGANLRIGVRAARDAADADQRDVAASAPPHLREERGRGGEQGFAAEASGFTRMAALEIRRPRHRRVRDDHAVDGGLERSL